MISRFINQNSEQNTKYSAGVVLEYNGEFIIGYEQKGAKDTFSIGQPVYDIEKNIMGWLGIGFFENLNYSNDKGVRVPCEYWKICLPTEYCKKGKMVYTYWQMLEVKGEDNDKGE